MNPVAIVSHTYPTESDPSYGIFIRREAELVARFAKPVIIIPKVAATPLNRQYYRTLKPADDSFSKKQFTYISFPRKSFPGVTQKTFTAKLLRILSGIDLNLVHLHWLFPQSLAAPALKKNGYKVVQTIHGGDWYSNLENRTLFPLIQSSLEESDAIICVGKKLADDLKQTLPHCADKTVHIPHAIDTSLFCPAPADDLVDQQNETGKTELLCVANFYEAKGVDLLLQALSLLSNKNLHLRLVAPRSDHETASKIKSIISDQNLENQVTISGSTGEKELIELYRQADLFVLPSLKEGFGIVCAEAAACGTPVLATKSGGPEEIIDSQTGMLVEAGSAEALAKGIEAMLKKIRTFNPNTMHSYISGKFGSEIKTDRLKQLYSSVINGEPLSGT